jgi:hypothetical protein
MYITVGSLVPVDALAPSLSPAVSIRSDHVDVRQNSPAMPATIDSSVYITARAHTMVQGQPPSSGPEEASTLVEAAFMTPSSRQAAAPPLVALAVATADSPLHTPDNGDTLPAAAPAHMMGPALGDVAGGTSALATASSPAATLSVDDEPVGAAPDALGDMPVYIPVDVQADSAAHPPGSRAVTGLIDVPVEAVVAAPVEAAVGTPAATPGNEPRDTPADAPAEAATVAGAHVPTDGVVDGPVGASADALAGAPGDAPAYTPEDPPLDARVEAVVDASVVAAVASAVAAAVVGPAEHLEALRRFYTDHRPGNLHHVGRA